MEIRKYLGTGMLWIAFIYLLLGFFNYMMGNQALSILGIILFNVWDVGALIIFYLEGKKDEKTKTKKVGKRRGQTTPETI
jgi:hypothetical protein